MPPFPTVVSEAADVELEQALLGALIRQPRLVPVAASEAQDFHFFDPLHARIFAALAAWAPDAGPITPLTLTGAMRGDDGLKEVGPQYLANLALAAPAADSSQIRYLAIQVRESALRREAIQACQEAASLLRTSTPIAEALAPIVGTADEAARSTDKRRSQAAHAVATEAVERAWAAARGVAPPSVPTGLRGLDEATGGFQGGDLVVLPGRSGSGKSTLLAGIGLRAAMADHPVLVFSLEMRADQWIQRNITDLDCDTAIEPVPYQSFRTGRLTEIQLERATMASRLIQDIPMEICDADDLTVYDISARSRAFKAAHVGKLGLIVVDYLQIVRPAMHRDRSREQEVTAIARGLKALAKALGWPVLAGAQILTKGGDPKTANKEQIPTLAAIRESGGIEMEADIIIAPHRKAFFLRKNKPDVAEDDPEMVSWRADYRACKNQMKLYGLKFRHGAEFDLDLWCDMSAAAVRDERPHVTKSLVDEATKGLLEGI